MFQCETFRLLGMQDFSLGKSVQILESKDRICVHLLKSENGLWPYRFHSLSVFTSQAKSRFSESMIRVFLWGMNPKKVHKWKKMYISGCPVITLGQPCCCHVKESICGFFVFLYSFWVILACIKHRKKLNKAACVKPCWDEPNAINVIFVSFFMLCEDFVETK